MQYVVFRCCVSQCLGNRFCHVFFVMYKVVQYLSIDSFIADIRPIHICCYQLVVCFNAVQYAKSFKLSVVGFEPTAPTHTAIDTM